MILLKIDNKLIFQTAEEIMYCNPPPFPPTNTITKIHLLLVHGYLLGKYNMALLHNEKINSLRIVSYLFHYGNFYQ